MSIEHQIRSIIADLLDIEPDNIGQKACFREDLGADSLDLVELITILGQTFHTEIRDEEVRRLKTFGEVVHYIESKCISVVSECPHELSVEQSRGRKRAPGAGRYLPGASRPSSESALHFPDTVAPVNS